MERYNYQYCNKFDTINISCDFNQYLKITGTYEGYKGVHSHN